MTNPDAHILITDDHSDIRQMLGRYLEKNGFKVSLAEDAAAARRCLARKNIDLVLLDIMMPGEDGLSLCLDLSVKKHPPVILLTARSDEPDRVLGFATGADDYVVKPFSPRELLGRIRAVLRRSRNAPDHAPAPATGRYHFAGRTLDPITGCLTREGKDDVTLSTAELNVLRTLLDQPRIVLSREILLERARGRSITPFDRSIDNVISRLRRKVEDAGSDHPIIRTVWGEGYVLTVDVTRAPQ